MSAAVIEKAIKGILTEQAEVERRMAVCAHCPQLRAHQRCGKCGCFLPLKSRLKALQCPEKRW